MKSGGALLRVFIVVFVDSLSVSAIHSFLYTTSIFNLFPDIMGRNGLYQVVSTAHDGKKHGCGGRGSSGGVAG